MRIAHVRERHSPAGAGWQLASQLADGRWLLLEPARAWLASDQPMRAHNETLLRAPITTLDAFLRQRRGRIEALGALVEPLAARPEILDASDEDEGEGGELAVRTADLVFGPPILEPPTLRDFYAFEQHVGTMWRRRGQEIPEAWFRLPIFYFSNTSEIRGPGDPVWAPLGAEELDYELEVAAIVDTPALDLDATRAEEAIGGYTILNDWSARDLQREETTVRLGPAKGKDFASSIGPWIVTPDEVRDPHALEIRTWVNGELRQHSNTRHLIHDCYALVELLSTVCTLEPGDIVATGTPSGVGLLLDPPQLLKAGDVVRVEIEQIGAIENRVVDEPSTAPEPGV